MQQEQLIRVLNSGIVVHFDSKEEEYRFFQEVKSFGGKWINGDEIKLPEKPQQLPTIFNLHIDEDFVLSKVSAMCYHFGVFPTINYKQFKTAQSTVDIPTVLDSENFIVLHTSGNKTKRIGVRKTREEAMLLANETAAALKEKGKNGIVTVEKNSKCGRGSRELFNLLEIK